MSIILKKHWNLSAYKYKIWQTEVFRTHSHKIHSFLSMWTFRASSQQNYEDFVLCSKYLTTGSPLKICIYVYHKLYDIKDAHYPIYK